MKVCILGNSLTALTLAKSLVNLKIKVEILYIKKNLNLSKTRTIGISKSNIDYFNKKITNINPLLWKLKKIEIFSDNLSREKLVNFEKDNEQIFSIIQNHNLYEILKKELSNNKYCYSKIFNNNDVSSLKSKDLIINCDPQNIITKNILVKK